jgi:4-hydroxybutyrate CoA-transferase
MPRRIRTDDVPRLLHAGTTVFVQGGSGEPTELLSAIRDAGADCNGVRYVGVFPPGINRWDPASFAPAAAMTAFFATPELAPSLARGTTNLMPLRYSAIIDYLRHTAKLDFALIQVAPPDAAGMCSLGVSVDFVPSVLPRAGAIIAEINRRMPAPPGSPTIPLDNFSNVVEVDHPLVEPIGEPADNINLRLGQIIASLVNDGDTIQVGLGRLPTAILAALRSKNDLGFHSGLMAEPVLGLIENGNINGGRKAVDPGMAVTGIAFGSNAFYEAIGRDPRVLFRPASYTHDAGVLRGLDNFVAINSAIEVDLDGQINAEFVNGRQISGIGGLGDFMLGARLARGGRSIIALPSRTANGKSRIVGRVERVTWPRTEVDFVVTEHGVARLRDGTVEERAEALIAIASPEFRDELTATFRTARR